MNFYVSKLERAEVREGSATVVEKQKSAQMTAAHKIVGCSETTSNSIGGRVGIAPTQNKQSHEKFEEQYSVRSTARTRLQTTADVAEWDKVTDGRLGTRWDRAVEGVWKDMVKNKTA